MFEELVEYAILIALLVSTLFTAFLLTSPSQYGKKKGLKIPVTVQVVVLGDVGRSPRMQYHALSIAKRGGKVELIGYCESELHPDIVDNKGINVVPISPLPPWMRASSKFTFLFMAPFKVLWQIWSLYYALGYNSDASQWMLVQNPPSIPTLIVARIICFLRHTNLVIDWHNFGYSILALRLGSSHPLVKLSRAFEKIMSQTTSYHFTVTNAMAEFLQLNWGIKALTLHDRPPATFQPLSLSERHTFLSRLPETSQHSSDLSIGSSRLIVSSTSWTPDEDFSILLSALVTYSSKAATTHTLPKILAIITGKGPQKEHYLSKIRELNQARKLDNVIILTAWLSTNDYASLLGAADLGISLHTSSSGLDLPMKVVDMFGAGLPVLGWSAFKAWPELVKEDVNGKGFISADELCALLVGLFGEQRDYMKKLKEGAMGECKRRWDNEWDPVAGKLFGLVN